MSLQSRLQSLISAIGSDVKSINNRLNGITSVPTGVMLPFAGSVAPSGFLMCSGQLVSRTEYANLFAVIGTSHGAGDGSTTFQLPNLFGRVLAGGYPGYLGGSSTKVITEANLPPHQHHMNHQHMGADTGSNSGAHRHMAIEEGSNASGVNNRIKADGGSHTSLMSYSADGAHSHDVTIPFYEGYTGTGQGSSTPLDITPPYLAENMIIKT